ncbi:MAG: hypothetical protein U0168_20730 [Nannocystaceae bacterium]
MVPVPRGYNHDVRYRGQIFHVQSEVSGHDRRQACTQLFMRGAVLATERTALPDGVAEAEVQALLRTQHKAVLRELCRGTFDDWLAPTGESAITPVPGRPPVPPRQLALKRRGVALELSAADDPERCELRIEVRAGRDVLASRNVGYEPCDPPEQVTALLDAEIEAMMAKIRRGGLDVRLPAVFVFVPPPIPPAAAR